MKSIRVRYLYGVFFLFIVLFYFSFNRKEKNVLFSMKYYDLFQSVEVEFRDESIFWVLRSIPEELSQENVQLCIKLIITDSAGGNIATWPDFLIYNLHEIAIDSINDFSGKTYNGRVFLAPLGLLHYKNFRLEESFVIWLNVFTVDNDKYSPVFIRPYFFENYDELIQLSKMD